VNRTKNSRILDYKKGGSYDGETFGCQAEEGRHNMSARKQIRHTVAIAVAVFYLLAVAAPALASPPTIEGESVSEVNVSDATLEAVVDPGNLEAGAYYQFQLVADPSEYWPEVTCPEQSPEGPEIQCLGPYGTIDGPPPEADIQRRPGDLPTLRLNGGAEGVPVSLRLSTVGRTLQPGTTYHYRVLAVEAVQSVDSIIWEPPPTYGPDQTFTTPVPREPEAGGPPIVDPLPAALAAGSEPAVAAAVSVGCRSRPVNRRHLHRRSLARVSLCARRPAR